MEVDETTPIDDQGENMVTGEPSDTRHVDMEDRTLDDLEAEEMRSKTKRRRTGNVVLHEHSLIILIGVI